MSKIALLPGGFKPPHAGHYNMAKWLADKTGATVLIRVGAKEREGITREMSLKLWELYTQDDNNIIVVSVSGDMPNFKINGWMYSEDGKRPQWERDYNNQGKPAYFVPHEELLNPYDLKDVV